MNDRREYMKRYRKEHKKEIANYKKEYVKEHGSSFKRLQNRYKNSQRKIDLASKLLKKYIGILDETADLYFENVLSILEGE